MESRLSLLLPSTSLGRLIGACALLTAPATHAQTTARSDFLTWATVGVHVQRDSSAWTYDAIYYNLRYQNARRQYIHLGTAQFTYNFARHGLALVAGYNLGDGDNLGRVQIAQLRLLQVLSNWKLRPRWRLTLDRLWLSARAADGRRPDPVYRVRYQVGIEPKLTPKLDLVFNTEPFLYRTGSWLQEVRSQAGLQVHPSHRLALQLLYFQRWIGYRPARVGWEHAAFLNTTLVFGGGHQRKHRPQ